ncbi:MAG TPA: hypothetical protein DCO89_02015 [Clostridiales bacterium]|nr:hypothetical protein [Clostridiales bacterium]
MENVLKLLGKPVVSIYNGTLEGFVKNILVDKKLKKIAWLEIFDDENQDEKILDATNIYALNNDAIMIKNNEKLYVANTIDTNCINPIGYKVYNINGKYENKITDLVFDEKLYVKSIVLQDDLLLDEKSVLNVGNNIIIKTDETVKIQYFKPKSKIKLSINKEEKVEALEEKNAVIIKSHPNKILTAGYEFLIGRKVGQNIYSETKQLLVKKNSKITNQIIDIASQNGKLKELTTYSVI